mmetsp:Transcript_26820/g.86122  ORF Transcript_26820/g.86122 Transcript_26820/m.86122 type:complete len:291 (-) Transcript_26820:143-1015(-)
MSKAVRRAPFHSLIQEITHTNSAAHTADERRRPSRSLVPSLLRRGEQRAQLITRPELKAGRSGRLLERGNLLAQQGQRASQRRRHPRLVHARLGLGYLQQRVLLATLEVQSRPPHGSAATRRAALEPHPAELAWRAARPRQLRRPLARDWLPAREVAEKCLLPRGAATRAALPHLLEGARLVGEPPVLRLEASPVQLPPLKPGTVPARCCNRLLGRQLPLRLARLLHGLHGSLVRCPRRLRLVVPKRLEQLERRGDRRVVERTLSLCQQLSRRLRERRRRAGAKLRVEPS